MLSRKSLTPTLAAAGAFGALALLVACGGQSGVGPAQTPVANVAGGSEAAVTTLRRGHPFTTTPIQHIVIVIQENRSFDNLFNGYPGANTVQSGMAVPVGTSGTPIPGRTPMAVPLQQQSLAQTWDIVHTFKSWQYAYNNGAYNGFSEEKVKCYNPQCHAPDPSTYPTYAYVPQSQTAPYWAMASQYVLADNMFASHVDASFVAHQYLIAGWAHHAVNYPNSSRWGCDGGQPVLTLTKNRKLGAYETACYQTATLASELDDAHLDWRYYATGPSDTGYLWSAFDAIKPVRQGPEWTNGSNAKVINPPSQFLTDVAAGNLVTGVTWITPSLANSDHADSNSLSGPSWVASVVNAVGQSQFWNTTAIFVLWDDWGGWYDHVVPPWLDFDGLGFRVPMLIISPYAKQGYVTHVQYEFGSILKFAEGNFGLPPVAPTTCCYGKLSSEKRANDPAVDAFNFSATPRPFSPIPSTLKREHFVHEMPDSRPPDDD